MSTLLGHLSKFLPIKYSANYRMSTQGLKRPMRAYARDPRRRKVVLNVDLNDTPLRESGDSKGTSSHCAQPSVPPVAGMLLNAPIDVETIDDEIIITSPRSFSVARNESRRRNAASSNGNAVTVVLDDDADPYLASSERSETRFALSGHEADSGKGGKDTGHKSPWASAVGQKEPTFTCAICMGILVEEHSTICGHIFCKKCIKTAITAQKKCPTCRRCLKMNSIHRVYLPTTS